MCLAVGTALMVSAAVSTQAYLTRGTAHLVNQLIPGSVKVKLTEPHWDPEKKQQVFPGKSAIKDPIVENTGSLDEWVFLSVKIPIADIVAVDPVSKRKMEKKKMEVFSFDADLEWVLLKEEKRDKEKEYVFGYKKKLAPGEKTSCLFQKITSVNYLEGELSPSVSMDVPVKAMGIQGNIGGENQDLKTVYGIYLEQKTASSKE